MSTNRTNTATSEGGTASSGGTVDSNSGGSVQSGGANTAVRPSQLDDGAIYIGGNRLGNIFVNDGEIYVDLNMAITAFGAINTNGRITLQGDPRFIQLTINQETGMLTAAIYANWNGSAYLMREIQVPFINQGGSLRLVNLDSFSDFMGRAFGARDVTFNDAVGGYLFASTIDSFEYEWTGTHVNWEFLVGIYEIASDLDIKPDDLMAVMAFESWIDPAAVNRISGATGLIQFMPSTARSLGTTTEALARMSAIEQLDYVFAYLRPFIGRMNTLSDIYMAILWPAAVGKPDDYVLWTQGSVQYRQNSGLDINGDGKITKGEAVQRIINRRDANYNRRDSN
jgi:hypothetical protein